MFQVCHINVVMLDITFLFLALKFCRKNVNFGNCRPPHPLHPNHNFKEALSKPSSIPLPRAGDRKLNNPFNVASLKF